MTSLRGSVIGRVMRGEHLFEMPKDFALYKINSGYVWRVCEIASPRHSSDFYVPCCQPFRIILDSPRRDSSSRSKESSVEAISKYDFREPFLPIEDEKWEKDRGRRQKQKHLLASITTRRNFYSARFTSRLNRLIVWRCVVNKICVLEKLF